MPLNTAAARAIAATKTMKIELTIPRRAMLSAQKAISKDETRYVLTGFNLRSLNGFAVLAATDGKQLISIQICPTQQEFNVILPNFIPQSGSIDPWAEIDTETGRVKWITADRETSFRLIDGKYPDYPTVFMDVVSQQGLVCLNTRLFRSIMSSAEAYAPKEALFVTPNQQNAAVFAISNCPEWYGLLMPVRDVGFTPPTWLKPAKQ